MGQVKAWLALACEVTGLDYSNDSLMLSKLFNACKGSTDPETIKQTYTELTGLPA